MTQSIHRKYRWRYILWSCLLLLSLGALALWESPSHSGKAEINLIADIHGAPKGCSFAIWSGPKAKAHAIDASGYNQKNLAGVINEKITLFVAYRRGMGITIPRRTSDLVVIKFKPPTGHPKYLAIPLAQDWTLGALKPGSHTTIRLVADWDGLWENPDTPIQVVN